MVDVTFTGSISKQSAAGEIVSIKVTKPDNSTETLTTTTKADLSLTPVVKAYDVAGNYSAIASVVADAGYLAASSPSMPFIVSLQARSIVLNVSVV